MNTQIPPPNEMDWQETRPIESRTLEPLTIVNVSHTSSVNFMQVVMKRRCSKCKTVDDCRMEHGTTQLTNGVETYDVLICNFCGHRKVTNIVLTTTNTTSPEMINVPFVPLPEYDDF